MEQDSYPDVYKSESTSVELDITVPPWSGSEELEITFRPVPLTHDGNEHHWRICRCVRAVCLIMCLQSSVSAFPRIDVAEVSEDLTCLAHGQAKYTPAVNKTYSKTNENDLEKWYFDVGTLNIAKTCPSQINETGHFKFRARAFYESYPQV